MILRVMMMACADNDIEDDFNDDGNTTTVTMDSLW